MYTNIKRLQARILNNSFPDMCIRIRKRSTVCEQHSFGFCQFIQPTPSVMVRFDSVEFFLRISFCDDERVHAFRYVLPHLIDDPRLVANNLLDFSTFLKQVECSMKKVDKLLVRTISTSEIGWIPVKSILKPILMRSTEIHHPIHQKIVANGKNALEIL